MFWTSNSEPLHLMIAGEAVAIELVRHPRARRLTLRADPLERRVRLTLPPGVSRNQALAFASSRELWIERRFATQSGPVAVAPGVLLPVCGVDRRIVWDADWARSPRLLEDRIELGGPADRIGPRLLRWLRTQAQMALAADLADYCARAEQSVPQLGLGDPRRRWGSCSTRSGIRLSWRLVMAPESVRRSVVAHEVAHLVHMNHGREFHALHARLFEGDVATADSWLRDHGAGLHRFRFD